MCPNFSHPSVGTVQSRLNSTTANVAAIRQYTLPVYRENGAGAYIEFFAFDPESCKMRRKTIKLNRINGLCKRRKYAKEVINRLTEQLQHGWNPWIAKDTTNLLTFEEGVARYETYIEKMISDGLYRKETYAGYKSYLKIQSVQRIPCRERVSASSTDRRHCPHQPQALHQRPYSHTS